MTHVSNRVRTALASSAALALGAHARSPVILGAFVLGALILIGGCGDDVDGPQDAAPSPGEDARIIDASPPDASPPDAPPPDAPPPDAPPPDAPVADCTPTPGTDLVLDPIATGLSQPLFVTAPPDDPRLFIVERSGVIKVVENGVLLTTPFLDLSDQVEDQESEQGLLGLAFHPQYAQNGRFFVDYIAPRPTPGDDDFTVVAEYKVSPGDGNVADPTEKSLLTVNQPRINHNGGMLAFGPDGLLYIGLGDSGGGNDPDDDAENTTTLRGAILRIDIDNGDPYGIPASNPFAGSANGPTDPRPEIWAFGLRNPWRFSFDRQTGDLYIADVGQRALEEIDVQPADAPGGQNYGWDIFEADSCVEPDAVNGCSTTGLTMPVAQYDHNGGRCSVTGGYVYRGTCLPDIQGTYFYADLCSDQVFAFELQDGMAQNQRDLGRIFGDRISSFGEDATGELYVVNLGTGPGTGAVSRVVVQSAK